jgi:hypothetical protein
MHLCIVYFVDKAGIKVHTLHTSPKRCVNMYYACAPKIVLADQVVSKLSWEGLTWDMWFTRTKI